MFLSLKLEGHQSNWTHCEVEETGIVVVKEGMK